MAKTLANSKSDITGQLVENVVLVVTFISHYVNRPDNEENTKINALGIMNDVDKPKIGGALIH